MTTPSPLHRRPRLRMLAASILAGSIALAIALPATASAMLVGVQSDNLTRAFAPATREAAFVRMQSIGSQVLRTELSWNEVAINCGSTWTKSPASLASPDAPCYNWTRYDDLAARAKAHGQQLLFSTFEAPRWANNHPNPMNVGASSAQYSKVVNAYATFLHAAAARYRAGSPHGFVAYWTIWNEPNSRTFWAPFNSDSPRRFALMVAKGGAAIKSASPRAKVAPGPTGPNSTGMKPVNYIRAVQPWLLRYGARRVTDAWAHNPYPAVGRSPHAVAYSSPSIGIGNFRDLLRTLDASPATRGRQVWATEFAYQTRPQDRTGVSAAQQATFLAECFSILASTHRVQIASWYVLQDPTNPVDWQSGLVYANGKAKPSLGMFQRMVALAAPSTRRGGRVGLWGRSNVSPRTGLLLWSPNGKSWTRVPGQHRASDGSIVASPVFRRSMVVAVKDAKGIGPGRPVHAG